MTLFASDSSTLDNFISLLRPSLSRIMSYNKGDLTLLLFSVLQEWPPLAFAEDNRGPDPELFAEIALRESGGNPMAFHQNTNGTYDRGLWQINSSHQAEFNKESGPWTGIPFRTACYTPKLNCAMALAIWRKQGYDAWSSFKSLP